MDGPKAGGLLTVALGHTRIPASMDVGIMIKDIKGHSAGFRLALHSHHRHTVCMIQLRCPKPAAIHSLAGG
jgi:hypothetical protein